MCALDLHMARNTLRSSYHRYTITVVGSGPDFHRGSSTTACDGATQIHITITIVIVATISFDVFTDAATKAANGSGEQLESEAVWKAGSSCQRDPGLLEADHMESCSSRCALPILFGHSLNSRIGHVCLPTAVRGGVQWAGSLLGRGRRLWLIRTRARRDHVPTHWPWPSSHRQQRNLST